MFTQINIHESNTKICMVDRSHLLVCFTPTYKSFFFRNNTISYCKIMCYNKYLTRSAMLATCIASWMTSFLDESSRSSNWEKRKKISALFLSNLQKVTYHSFIQNKSQFNKLLYRSDISFAFVLHVVFSWPFSFFACRGRSCHFEVIRRWHCTTLGRLIRILVYHMWMFTLKCKVCVFTFITHEKEKHKYFLIRTDKSPP